MNRFFLLAFFFFNVVINSQELSVNIESDFNINNLAYRDYTAGSVFFLIPVSENIEIGPSLKFFYSKILPKIFDIKYFTDDNGINGITTETGIKLHYCPLHGIKFNNYTIMPFVLLGVYYQFSDINGVTRFSNSPYNIELSSINNSFVEEIAFGFKLIVAENRLRIFSNIGYVFQNSDIKVTESKLDFFSGNYSYFNQYKKNININSLLMSIGLQIVL